ncbi:uncharacterized protein LOC110185861 [Drosophila serrata]|uniref:uncharacterized protein LOC110185861 n=1 Tax=Drosophila serrata TaxID=7274 RepID=UPI000A1D29BB|nr:uncharacterized protein LOC110185861 [Drosophila serrata]KAH8393598.1 hypothetical protein KR200_005836 [Drosophila serrata]
MAKILQKYIKFSGKALESYAANPESCVRCINSDMHLAMGPYGMARFKHALHELLIRTKVGIYDSGLDGIVLGIKNIKVQGHTAALRADDPTMHLVINADFYIFRPITGVILDGVVRHISKHQVSAVIYRVFNTTIRFSNKMLGRESLVMDQEIKFRIKNFDISNAMPYIEGELLLEDGEEPQNKSIKFSSPEPEKKANDFGKEDPDMLDALLDSLNELPDQVETPIKKSPPKRKKATVNGEATTKAKQVKKEIKTEPI